MSPDSLVILAMHLKPLKKQFNRKGFRIAVFVLTYLEIKYYKCNNITKFMKTKKKFCSVGSVE